jgi:hypothetical protein
LIAIVDRLPNKLFRDFAVADHSRRIAGIRMLLAPRRDGGLRRDALPNCERL